MSISSHSKSLTLLSTALLAASMGTACAQTVPAAAPSASRADTTLAAGVSAAKTVPFKATSDPRLARVDAAIDAASRGDFDATVYGDLADHPLYGWIEYASLRRGIDNLTAQRGTDFLTRHRGEAVAETFRDYWLAELSRREDWPTFLATWRDDVDAFNLKCARLNARQAMGQSDGAWVTEAQAAWNRNGDALPRECDAPMSVLAAKGGLSDAMRWARLDKAATAGNASVMRDAASGLPGDQKTLANDYAAFIDKVHPSALQWPGTDRSRLIASLGLARLGKQDPDLAEAQLPLYADALGFTEADRGRVLYQIALWTVASYLPDSERRLNAVPDVSMDERLREWKMRGAMARSDWPAALSAIREMDDDQRSDSRFTYFEARLAEKAGDTATAQRLYRKAATIPEFHGFLAADRIDRPYALCPWQVDASAAEQAEVANTPALLRAMRLHQIGRHSWAVKEWHSALDGFDDRQRRTAVGIAQAYGWYDRAVFSLGRDDPRERQLYTLRFPLDYDATIRREAARYRIDPAWVAAEIRAESIFNPKARSPANAMGLMQVLPGTGAAVSRRIGEPWGGTQSLYDPETNIQLGTAYLREMMDKTGGKPYFAMAGYNAGPVPLARWQSQRPGMDADFWIETISYKETREYVARVLAFSVIYDWRLDGDALRLQDRMQGRTQGERKRFTCPAPIAAAPDAG